MVSCIYGSTAMYHLAISMCFTKKDLTTYKPYFDDLGITDEEKMLAILNNLDLIAEIGYAHYKKNKNN